ncbi:DegT/DnrJ/EryC1/StrS family aminotransferase [Methylobacterium iners]|uniref:GDP-4-keto-6-deoxy-D-mannose 3-dehydratase n=1 Tax=Methylobacterium iners TaxID=418707 RepID=A0ABQ4S0K0_9HYPH|nr:DegT/DnrJ/EryC1/StrS family aminotransferase [Methylobacterium iners]GJD96653.1 GDP-4-keto-6-deoxy-D-mannose 3-dehydratase [Methylobacterium iners]
MSYRFPLATTTWDEAEYEALQRVIAAGTFTMGRAVHEFENRFADWQGSRYSVMVNSGSSANLLMIAALMFTGNEKLRLKAGDEVIVPAVSWATTYYPVSQYGLKLKFVDIDIETLNFDLESLRNAITDRTRAVLAVNLLGNPNDFSSIMEIIGRRNILVLEDNCEAMGAKFEGRRSGSFGVMGTFSTFFSHHISTMEGGLIATDDEELYHILLSLRAHGWTRNLPKHNLVTGTKSDDDFDESFKFVLPGYNVRPLEMSGALGIEQLKKLPSIISARRDNAALFCEVMSEHPDLMIQKEIGESSWFGFSLVIRGGSDLTRKALVERLNNVGLESRPIVAGNFTRNPVINHLYSEIAGELVNADHVHNYGVFIGNHHYEIRDAISALGAL